MTGAPAAGAAPVTPRGRRPPARRRPLVHIGPDPSWTALGRYLATR